MIPTANSPSAVNDKRKRLLLRKEAMFRRANSLDSLCSMWGCEQSSPPSSPTTRRSTRRKPARISRVVSESDATPLLSEQQQRWETAQPNTDQAPRIKKADRPPTSPNRSSRTKRSRSKAASLSPPPRPCNSQTRENAHQRPRPKYCRWNSDKSFDKKDSMPRSTSRPRQLSPARSSPAAARLTLSPPRKPLRQISDAL
ncbi:expressed unknown protein [Seminavis robusta]|uniref:Uncharacterized protein n=1 Tax=Seminavis robusta TaxID=568900 RepID=A0A9N8DSG7_9STRA|nr:expressed unknown protein [Seminavis robusta]|eukprot:Sro310_g113960.1 n/a (199) ;mRNA; f:11298-11894